MLEWNHVASNIKKKKFLEEYQLSKNTAVVREVGDECGIIETKGREYGYTYLVLLCFTLLSFTVMFFYKSKERPSTSKKITTCFIAVVGMEPAISPRYTCISRGE